MLAAFGLRLSQGLGAADLEFETLWFDHLAVCQNKHVCRPGLGALIIRIGFRGPIYHIDNKEPLSRNNIGNY